MSADIDSILDTISEEVATQATGYRFCETRDDALEVLGNSFHRIYIDIETVPDWRQALKLGIRPIGPISAPISMEFLPDPIAALAGTVDAFGNVCNPEDRPCNEWLDRAEKAERAGKSRKGVLDRIAACRSAVQEHQREVEAQLKRLSLCPETCQIVQIGIGSDNGTVGVFSCDEPTMIRCLFEVAGVASKIVGYNILAFDLPVLAIRSMILGLQIDEPIRINRYNDRIIDLYDRRFPGRKDDFQPGGLKDLAKLHGIVPTENGLRASDVSAAWNAGDVMSIAAYLASDIKMTRELDIRYRGFFS
jgi:hypothetical protein